MKQLGLAYFTDTHLTVIGLFIFLGAFIVFFLKAMALSKKQAELFSKLPLDLEGEVNNESR